MRISIICAMDEKRGIGKDNKIPWHIRDDLIRLKNLTKDHVVVLGRKSYDSMVYYYNRTGNPMPGKLYIVVTRDNNYKPARGNAVVAHSLEEAIKKADSARHSGDSERSVEDSRISSLPSKQGDSGQARMTILNGDEVFIIGGGQIFQQALPLANKLYLTIVESDYQCDTFFPDYSAFKKVISEESKESEGHRYKFLEVERQG